MEVGGQRHTQVALPPGNGSVLAVQQLGGPDVDNLVPLPTRIRPPDRPARTELQYRLSYRGPITMDIKKIRCD